MESALTTVAMLRGMGCVLPVEIWHRTGEVSSAARTLMAIYTVTPRTFEDVIEDPALLKPYDFTPAYGTPKPFQLKSIALLHSAFEEVLCLDADNTPVKDVSYLFDHETYRASGVVMWPDYWKTNPENPIWRVVQSLPWHSREQESGQLLVNKKQRWRDVNLHLHFSSREYSQLMYGEKDAMKYACAALKSPCHMVAALLSPVGTRYNGRFLGMSMMQHGLEGEFLFLHHNNFKSYEHVPGMQLDLQQIATFRNEDMVRMRVVRNVKIDGAPEWFTVLEPVGNRVHMVTEVETGLATFTDKLKHTWADIHAKMMSG